MESNALTKSVVVGLALTGTVAAFAVGAQAGTFLHGTVMAISVARVPMPVLASTKGSHVNTHVR